jgi:hypothetical protein
MRKVLGVAWRFLLVYGLVVALWVAGLERGYNDALAWACTRFLTVFEEPRMTVGLHRRGNLLVVEHIPHFGCEQPQEIVTRRVHSNTALFVALTLATPAVGWAARGLWLAGGAVLLSVAHAAHILAYVHWNYALHNMGPYFSQLRLDESAQLGWRACWGRPATWRREVALATADVFNIVAQRVVPIALWLPLFIGGWVRRGAGTPAAGGGAERRGVHRWGVLLGAVVLCAGGGAVLLGRTQPQPPAEIEGVRLGMSAADATVAVERRGYIWVPAVSPPPGADGLVVDAVDVWLKLFDPRWVEPRYNWIGVQLAYPMGAAQSMACVTGIVTVASDDRPQTHRLQASDPRRVCGALWAGQGGPP